MADNGEYEASPWEWVSDQVEKFEASGGKEAGDLNGVPIVVLTTRGNKSGKIRKTPLMRVNDGDRYAIVASMGGAPKHPVWYHNIKADPSVQLQDGETLRPYVAHEAEGDERTEWWERAAEVWPDYDNYATKTDRVIPVFVLVPAD